MREHRVAVLPLSCRAQGVKRELACGEKVKFGVAAWHGNGHSTREPGGHAQTGQERRA